MRFAHLSNANGIQWCGESSKGKKRIAGGVGGRGENHHVVTKRDKRVSLQGVGQAALPENGNTVSGEARRGSRLRVASDATIAARTRERCARHRRAGRRSSSARVEAARRLVEDGQRREDALSRRIVLRRGRAVGQQDVRERARHPSVT